MIKILAIETSCDETAAAVITEVNGNPQIVSNVISSQIDLHKKTGGVVPEVASRAHMEAIVPVVIEAIISAINNQTPRNNNQENINTTIKQYNNAISFLQKEIDYIAVTTGPGLIGSLLVGFNAAKTLSYALNLPIVPINHIEGHIYSAFTKATNPENNFKFPILVLTVSGGHTSLILMKDHNQYQILGETIDDAVGEAYDKVAKLLGLGYPGGPIIAKLAAQFRERLSEKRPAKSDLRSTLDARRSDVGVVFPRPILNDGTFNFSLSGLKTAVLREVIEREKNAELTLGDREEIAFAFEESVAEILSKKTAAAVAKFLPKAVSFVGGVSANGYLRDKIELEIKKTDDKLSLLTPAEGLSGDNAAMIGLAAFYHIKRNTSICRFNEIKVNSNLKLVG